MAELSFGVRTGKDFYQKLKEEYADFLKAPLSSRHAINCAMTAWHLIEWVYRDSYPAMAVSRTEGKRSLDTYRQTLFTACPDLLIMSDIADGSKHCKLDRKKNIVAASVTGSFSRQFSRHFDIVRFIVLIDENRTVNFEDSLARVMSFWEARFVDS